MLLALPTTDSRYCLVDTVLAFLTGEKLDERIFLSLLRRRLLYAGLDGFEENCLLLICENRLMTCLGDGMWLRVHYEEVTLGNVKLLITLLLLAAARLSAGRKNKPLI
jgi:hypothetical protein